MKSLVADESNKSMKLIELEMMHFQIIMTIESLLWLILSLITYVLRLMVGFGSRGSVSHVRPTKTDNMIKTKIINRHIRMALNLSLVNILP